MTFSLDISSFDAYVSKDLAEVYGLQKYHKEPMLSHIAPIERRRLDQGAKGVFTLLQDCQCPIIFSSFNGEINRSLKMYETLKQDQLIAPTTFSLSVLNAIPALCAILFKNFNEIIAISNCMSVEYGFLNAFLLLQQENVSECLIIAYREIEKFFSPNGVVILALRVKKGSKFQLKQSQNEKCFLNKKREESEIVFLKNYDKHMSWLSFSCQEQWEWNVSS